MEAPSSLREYVEAQDKLDREARELFPYDFSTCSYEQGYVKQQVFSCLTCTPKDGGQRGGVCYGCSITCHGDHELVELFNRRAFRCDCGSDRLSGQPCRIRKDTVPLNADNKYNQNYDNIFCMCKTIYDAANEADTMFQCLLCEDWYHDRCIKTKSLVPPEDDFEDYVCRSCVGQHPWLLRYLSDPRFACTPKRQQEEQKSTDGLESDVKIKHGLCEAAEEDEKPNKKLKLADDEAKTDQDKSTDRCAWEDLPDPKVASQDLFLLEHFRDRICKCKACRERMSSCLPIMVEEEVYDPPTDSDDNESSFDAGTRAMESTLQSMPREKAIEGILAYNKLKDHIASCLKPLAESGEIITKEHVATFFEKRR